MSWSSPQVLDPAMLVCADWVAHKLVFVGKPETRKCAQMKHRLTGNAFHRVFGQGFSRKVSLCGSEKREADAILPALVHQSEAKVHRELNIRASVFSPALLQ